MDHSHWISTSDRVAISSRDRTTGVGFGSIDSRELRNPAFVAIPVVVGEASTTSVSDEHNWHVFNGPDSSSPSLASTQIITGPGTMDSVTFTAPTQTGDYFFWCDVHTTLMTGTLAID